METTALSAHRQTAPSQLQPCSSVVAVVEYAPIKPQMAPSVQMHSGVMRAALLATTVSDSSNGVGHANVARLPVLTPLSTLVALLLTTSNVVGWATALRACVQMHSGRTIAAMMASPA